MSKHRDRRDKRLPAGVTRIDVATNGVVRVGHPWCYRARVMVNGVLNSERFPASTPIALLSAWIAEQRGTIRQQHQSLATLAKGTFEADVENEYLPQVRHLTAHRERCIDIRRWAKLFRGRNRNTIRVAEIRKIVSGWAAGIGTDHTDRYGRVVKGGKLAASTLNHRLSALSNFYELLNGKRGYNPVAEIERFDEGDRPINALDFDIIKKILAELEDNVTGARIRCLAYTGIRPIQLERLQPHHIDLNKATVWVPVGKGGKSELIHLPRPGVQAFKDLVRFADDETLHRRFRHKWGAPISGRNLRMTLRRAAKNAKYEGPITVYWLRHSLATHMLDQGASTRQIQQQLTHSSLDLIERYTKVQNSKGLKAVMNRIA